MIRRPPRATLTATLFPYPALFRSIFVAAVGEPAIGLEQDRGAQELVAVPPIAGAARRAASAQDAFVQAVELFAVLGRLQSLLAARRRRPGLQPRFEDRKSTRLNSSH